MVRNHLMMVLAQPVNVEWLAIVVMVCLNVALAVAPVDRACGGAGEFASLHRMVERFFGLFAFGVLQPVSRIPPAPGCFACGRFHISRSPPALGCFACGRLRVSNLGCPARWRLRVSSKDWLLTVFALAVPPVLFLGTPVEVVKDLFFATPRTSLRRFHCLSLHAPAIQSAESGENADQRTETIDFHEPPDSRTAYHPALTIARSFA